MSPLWLITTGRSRLVLEAQLGHALEGSTRRSNDTRPLGSANEEEISANKSSRKMGSYARVYAPSLIFSGNRVKIRKQTPGMFVRHKDKLTSDVVF